MVLILAHSMEQTKPAAAAAKSDAALHARLEEGHGAAWSWSLTCCGGDRGKAEDVLQNSYLKVLEGRARWQESASFQTFLFAVIRNTAKDSYRGPWANRRDSLAEDDEAPLAVLPPTNIDPLAQDRLQQALFRLPERPRQILSLVYGHGFTLKEAANLLDIAPGSAASHLARAKQRLRSLLGVEGEEHHE